MVVIKKKLVVVFPIFRTGSSINVEDVHRHVTYLSKGAVGTVILGPYLSRIDMERADLNKDYMQLVINSLTAAHFNPTKIFDITSGNPGATSDEIYSSLESQCEAMSEFAPDYFCVCPTYYNPSDQDFSFMPKLAEQSRGSVLVGKDPNLPNQRFQQRDSGDMPKFDRGNIAGSVDYRPPLEESTVIYDSMGLSSTSVVFRVSIKI